jgi:hypothetical protein
MLVGVARKSSIPKDCDIADQSVILSTLSKVHCVHKHSKHIEKFRYKNSRFRTLDGYRVLDQPL